MSFASVIPFRSSATDIDQAAAFLDGLPTAVMLCDPRHLVVVYANQASIELLKSIEHILPIKAEAIVGTSIDVFHKNPGHQRKLLADPNNLPHRATIAAGDQHLDLSINAVRDGRGGYRYAQLVWSVVTEQLARERETARLLTMIDNMPINVMTCDLDDFRITYANRTSLETLRRIEAHLPVKADALVGTSIDVFHKQPSHQRRLLADPANLPHAANIRVGPETLNLRVSAIRDGSGTYLGPMVTWSIVTDSVAMTKDVSEVVGAMGQSVETMQSASGSLLGLTERAEATAAAVSAAAVEMSASFDEISGQIRQAADTSQEAADKAAAANGLVHGLADSVERIGAVTTLIETIAGQTNLLALNATIEAARAGEAGKGFAVVASEVKALAAQTAKATQEIRGQVEAVQAASGAAAGAVSGIAGNVGEMSGVFVALAAGMEQQAATNRTVSATITGVSDAARQTRAAAIDVQAVAGDVSGLSARLAGAIDAFLGGGSKNG